MTPPVLKQKKFTRQVQIESLSGRTIIHNEAKQRPPPPQKLPVSSTDHPFLSILSHHFVSPRATLLPWQRNPLKSGFPLPRGKKNDFHKPFSGNGKTELAEFQGANGRPGKRETLLLGKRINCAGLVSWFNFKLAALRFSYGVGNAYFLGKSREI